MKIHTPQSQIIIISDIIINIRVIIIVIININIIIIKCS